MKPDKKPKVLPSLMMLLLLTCASMVSAAIPVAVLPVVGQHGQAQRLIASFARDLIREETVSLVSEDIKKQIFAIHKNAQQMNSGYHDISKLKLAQFLITPKIESNQLFFHLVDVNKGTTIVSRSVPLDRQSNGQIGALAKIFRDKIVEYGSFNAEDVPEEIKPFTQTIVTFVAALSKGNAAAYKQIAFFSEGKYKNPTTQQKSLQKRADFFISLLKKGLIHSKIFYLKHKNENGTLFVSVISEKFGKKNHHLFLLKELDDGSIAIIDHKYE